jgi:4-hydroxy-tetrahydrodipicolinate synthase
MREHKGVMVPMVTPFQESGDLDEKALRELTHYLIEKGVDSLFPAGSTGEGWSLSPTERRRMFDIVVRESRGRVAVYGGTGAVSTRESIELAKMAEEAGCDGMVMITPYYIVPKADELFDHYRAIAESVRIPVIPYNNPARAIVSMTADLVIRLSQVPNIVGLKDSGGNLGLHLRFINETRPGFSVFQGRDDLFYSSLDLGAVGIVAATANVAPDLVVRVYRTFMSGDRKTSLQTQIQLAKIRFALELGSFPNVIKEAMEMVGIKAGPTRAPVGKLSGEGREKLRPILKELGLI